MNERHKGQLKIAHQLYDNRDLKQELLYQREFMDTGYLSYQQVCFNKWIFDECLKQLKERKQGKWLLNDSGIPYCSECKNLQYGGHYCANCGAEMEDEE